MIKRKDEMKLRSDFVTNSSSSSFTTFQLDSKVVGKLLKEFEHLIINR